MFYARTLKEFLGHPSFEFCLADGTPLKSLIQSNTKKEIEFNLTSDIYVYGTDAIVSGTRRFLLRMYRKNKRTTPFFFFSFLFFLRSLLFIYSWCVEETQYPPLKKKNKNKINIYISYLFVWTRCPCRGELRFF